MTDLGYVVAAYGVILGGLAAYAAALLRRHAAARDAAARGAADGADLAPDRREPEAE